MIKELRDNLYFVDLILFWDCKQEEVLKYMKKEWNITDWETSPDLDAFHQIVELKNDGAPDEESFQKHVLYIGFFDWSIDAQETVAHELFHLVSKVLRPRGLTLTDESEEAFAYYYGYWFEKIWIELSTWWKRYGKRKYEKKPA